MVATVERGGLRERLLLEMPPRLMTLQTNNVDRRRATFYLTPRQRMRAEARSALRELALRAARRLGIVRFRSQDAERLIRRFSAYVPMLEQLEPLYAELVDDTSRDLLVEILLLRTLGSRHVKLSRNNPAYWSDYQRVDTLKVPGRSLPWPNFDLPLFAVEGPHSDVRVHAHPLTVLTTFLLKQYVCDRPHFRVHPEPGETVIDGGGCWGDSALFFADAVGPSGKVVCFEFVEDNLRVLEQNLALNPELARRIDLVRHPMWSRVGEVLQYSAAGASTRVGKGSLSATTETVDNIVSDRELTRVDFLKLDVEGAELQVLEGSRATLERFRPKLALSAYHRDDDLVRIPAFFSEAGLRYRWALDHFTIHAEETVLFGIPE